MQSGVAKDDTGGGDRGGYTVAEADKYPFGGRCEGGLNEMGGQPGAVPNP